MIVFAFANLIFFFLIQPESQACCSMQVESGDLIAYGLIPEFIGRFPILVSLSALNEDQLVQVIIFIDKFLKLLPIYLLLCT